MSETVRVLIVEDDPVDAELMVRELKRGGFAAQWTRVDTEEEFLRELDRAPDVILSDSKLPLFDGFEALDLLRDRGLDIPFILVSGRLGEDLAVEAMKRGACDYLLKDRLARLGEAVRHAVEERRLRAERAWAICALREREERYRLISETSSDYAYSLQVCPDGALKCEWISDPFTRLTGFNVDEINRSEWMNLYHSDDREIAAQHEQYVRAGKPDSMDIRILTKGGGVRWMRVYERPVGAETGAETGTETGGEAGSPITRIYGAAQDVTVQKQLEEQLIQSRKMEAIGQLAGGVAHDFNNLLTVICGYADLLRKQPGLGEEGQEYTAEIIEAAKRATQLTRQLLAFGRRQILRSRTVNLNRILSDIEKLLRRLIGEDVQLRIVYGAQPAWVKVDPGQMEQVVMNLAVNARDAMPRGGCLTIETSHVDFEKNMGREQQAPGGGSHIMLTVRDDGTGMDPETAARAFEPFFTTKEAGKGTGLGLAMAYGIVTQSGGDIRVVTAPGKGTAFSIYLPRVEHAIEAEETPTAFELHTEKRSETILVVEDERSLRTLMREVLTREGHTVLDTGDAEEAVALCRRHPGEISLLITDIVLPKSSGPQVAEAVAEIRPGVQIMYTSGYPGKVPVSDLLRQSGSVFFEKPFTADTLVRKVRAVLDEPRL
ncbi:MAG: response regulator [Acidobacteriota bacterium]|nr:response regulator [Acidobacteriota bacterium]